MSKTYRSTNPSQQRLPTLSVQDTFFIEKSKIRNSAEADFEQFPQAAHKRTGGPMKQEEQQLQYQVHRLLSSAEAVDQQKTASEQEHSRKRMSIFDIPDDGEIRSPTWDEAARKCIEVYREAISKYKNCSKR